MSKLFSRILFNSLILLASAVPAIGQVTGAAVSTDEALGYQVGDKATGFNLKNVDESMVSLNDFKDVKGYIVTFTCNTCPFSVLYEDRLVALHNKYAPLGYPVVAINSNDHSTQAGNTYEDMQLRAKEKAFPFVYLIDENQEIYPQYGASRTPHVFLLDKEMIVRYIGAIDDNSRSPGDVKEAYVANAIEALEKGEQPNPSFTKAVGCPISSGGGSVDRGGPPSAGGEGRRGGPPSPDKIMAELDLDKDQKISKSEAKGPLEKDFDRLDSNNDELLSAEELSKMAPPRRGH